MPYTITKSNIKREFQDMAGKWRVWVEMPDGEWQMMKFDKKPITAEVQKAVDNFLQAQEQVKQTELDRINEEIARLEERKKQLGGK